MSKLVKVEIEGLDSKGRGFGKVGDKTVYLNYVIPGDIVEAKIYPIKKRHREYIGKVVNFLSFGEGRVEPKCKFFGLCGGCRFQNWDYKYQLRYKKWIVENAAKKWNINIEVRDVVPSPKIWYYRNRMDYAISFDGKIGLKELGNWRNILDLSECFLLSKESNKILSLTREFMSKYQIPGWDLIKHNGFFRYVVIREGKFTNERMINYVTYKGFFKYVNELINMLTSENLITSFVWSINATVTDVSYGSEIRFLWGKDHLSEKINEYKFYIHPNAFFQTNSYQTPKLVEIVKNFSSGGKVLLDLYCGVGLFAISLSPMYNEVYGIEVEENAVNSGNISLDWNGVSNVEYSIGRVEDLITLYEDLDVDTVVLDPPRPGVSKKVIKSLIRMKPREIIYVSCNPESMFRDISGLMSEYYIENHIQPIDMFPHTPHVEVIVKLVRK